MMSDNCIHKKWMIRAIRLASLGRGFTSPNPLVGAIILDKKGKLISEVFIRKLVCPMLKLWHLTI